jgi:hypothetical protein
MSSGSPPFAAVNNQGENMSEQDTPQTTTNDDFASQLELEPEQVDPAEQPESQPVETKPEVEKEEAPADAPEQPAEEPKPEEAAEPTPEPEKQEEPQESEAERNRRFYEMRQKAKQEAERAMDRTYQAQPVDELTKKYTDQGYDEFQARMLANDERREQQAAINTARTEVAELNMTIESEALQVMHEFPIFDPKSPDYDKAFADKASALYHQAAGVQRDEQTGLIINASQTPYSFYKDLAEMRNSGLSKAQMDAQRAAEQQMAAVTPPASIVVQRDKSPEDKQADALAAAFDKV